MSMDTGREYDPSEAEGLGRERKTFPIPAACSRCGHQANIYIDDESLFKSLELYRKSRTNAIWAALMVPRMIISWIVAATIGLIVGGIWL